MSKASTRINWPAIVAGVVVARLLMQAPDWFGRASPVGDDLAVLRTVPAALHETLRTSLQAVAPEPWDQVLIGVSGVLVLAAWARRMLRDGP